MDDAVYSPSGHLLDERSPANAGVWALPFSLAELKATGESFLVCRKRGRRASPRTARCRAAAAPAASGEPCWGVDRQGKVVSRIGEPALRRSGAISPDGNASPPRSASTARRTSGSTTSTAARAAASRTTAKPGGSEWVGDGHSVVYDSFDTVRRSGSVSKRVSRDGSGASEEMGPGGGGVVLGDGHLFDIVISSAGTSGIGR